MVMKIEFQSQDEKSRASPLILEIELIPLIGLKMGTNDLGFTIHFIRSIKKGRGG